MNINQHAWGLGLQLGLLMGLQCIKMVCLYMVLPPGVGRLAPYNYFFAQPLASEIPRKSPWLTRPPIILCSYQKKHMEVSLNRGAPKPFMLFSDFPWDKPSSSWGTVPPFQEPPWWFLQKLCPRLHDPLELRKAHTVVPTGICLKIAGVNDVK